MHEEESSNYKYSVNGSNFQISVNERGQFNVQMSESNEMQIKIDTHNFPNISISDNSNNMRIGMDFQNSNFQNITLNNQNNELSDFSVDSSEEDSFSSGYGSFEEGDILSETEENSVPGLKKSDIYKIPTSLFKGKKTTELPMKKKGEKYTKCSICLLDYIKNDILRNLKCSHNFHKNCIDVWLEKSGSCPVCRYVLPRT